jgi:cytochrome P450
MEDRRDFMSYILKNRGKEGGITDKEVAANCGFLIIAGSEAPATAMSGITYYLLKNPEALMALTSEIRNAFQNEDDINFLSTSQNLPYLVACISEGMRVYPPTPHIPPRRTPPGKMTTIAGQKVPGWVSRFFPRNLLQS